jgi:hypothetical protein
MEDIKEAYELFEDFDKKYEAYYGRLRAALGVKGENGDEVMDDAREKGCAISFKIIDAKLVLLLGDASKDILRQLLISKGINRILDLKEKGRTSFDLHLLILYQ